MKKHYKPKQINITKLKSYLDKKPNIKQMQDSLQVGIANSTAIGLSIGQANELLTFCSLILAITFTIYKFVKFDKKKTD